MILAIDPGMSKIGWALTDDSGQARGQGIIPQSDWDNRLTGLVDLGAVGIVVIGDGTNRLNIEQGLRRLIPQAEFVVVDEKSSTVEAWTLKRREEAGSNPFRQVRFFLGQLFNPAPVDDYAARVLAARYLSKQA